MRRSFFAILVAAIVALTPFAPCAMAADIAKSPSDMLESALPAVVTIGVYETEKESSIYGFSGGRAASESAYGRMLALTGVKNTGSGFIVRHGGKLYVVTNAHVVDRARDRSDSISGFSINGTKYPMEIVGGDTLYDLAVLRFRKEPGKEVSFLEFRAGDTRIGETVYAIGNPLGGFPYSISQGIIGGKNRTRDGVTGRFGFLQSTATMIWGNSGGPLVDAEGRVVGVNSQIHVTNSPAGVVIHPQLNFALESRIAGNLVKEIIEKGEHQRSYIGAVFTQAISEEGEGMPFVSFLVPGSPASVALSGMEGALVTKVNDVDVRNLEEIFGELEATAPGGRIAMKLEKRGEGVTRSITTALLEPGRRSTLTNAALRRFAGIEIKAEAGRVLLTNADCAGSPGACGKRAILVLSSREGQAERLENLTGPFVVNAAGWGGAKEGVKLWKVRKPQDLETAIRVSAVGGVVVLVGTVEGKDRVLQLLLTEDEETLNKTLLY